MMLPEQRTSDLRHPIQAITRSPRWQSILRRRVLKRFGYATAYSLFGRRLSSSFYG